jgi:hypothetical protein
MSWNLPLNETRAILKKKKELESVVPNLYSKCDHKLEVHAWICFLTHSMP